MFIDRFCAVLGSDGYTAVSILCNDVELDVVYADPSAVSGFHVAEAGEHHLAEVSV
jgi:hypothetical protein